MKRILKYGKYMIITCSKCQCEYTFEETDKDAEGKVECPCCKNKDAAPAKA